jgi:hypothetical protein
MIRSSRSRRGSRARALRAAACASVVCAAAAGDARAQPAGGDAEAARGLFFEGRTLMDAQRWDEARVRLERSEALRPGKGTEFNLAECYEHLGRPAAAWTLYEKVAAESKAASLSAHEDLARERADAVAPRVPRLAVDAGPQAPVSGLAIEIDGARVAPGEYGRPVRVEPGHHHVFVAAPGWAAVDVELDLEEGESRVLRVPPLVALSSPSSPQPPETPAPVVAPPPREAPATPAPDPGAGWHTASLVAGGTGLAALVTGGVFTAMSLGARGSADEWCNSAGKCTSQQGVNDLSTATSQGNIATGFVVAGAVFLAAGAVLWLAAPRSGPQVAVGVSASAEGRVGITLQGVGF